MTVTIADAQAKTKQALKMIGWDDEDAGLQAEIMTAAELCGNNQGLVKMYQPALMAPHQGREAVDRARDAHLGRGQRQPVAGHAGGGHGCRSRRPEA